VLDAFHSGVDLLLNVDITPNQGSIQGGSGVNGNDGQGENGTLKLETYLIKVTTPKQMI